MIERLIKRSPSFAPLILFVLLLPLQGYTFLKLSLLQRKLFLNSWFILFFLFFIILQIGLFFLRQILRNNYVAVMTGALQWLFCFFYFFPLVSLCIYAFFINSFGAALISIVVFYLAYRFRLFFLVHRTLVINHLSFYFSYLAYLSVILVLSSCVSLVLLPHFCTSFVAFSQNQANTHLVDRAKNTSNYDVIALDKGSKVFGFSDGGALLYEWESSKYVQRLNINTVQPQRAIFNPATRNVIITSFTTQSPSVIRYHLATQKTFQYKSSACQCAVDITNSISETEYFVACEDTGKIFQLDVTENELTLFHEMKFVHSIAYSPDRKMLFAISLTGDLRAIDTDNSRIISKRYLFLMPWRIFELDGRDVLYVSRLFSDNVIVLSGETLENKGLFETGLSPRDMAYDLENDVLWIGNYIDGTIYRVDMLKNTVSVLFAGPKLRGIYYEKETKRIYFASLSGFGYFEKEDWEKAYQKPKNAPRQISDFLKCLLKGSGFDHLQKYLGTMRHILW